MGEGKQQQFTWWIHGLFFTGNFLWGLAFGSLRAFFPIWLRQKGLSIVQIGTIVTVGVAGNAMTPIFGALIDWCKLPALVICILACLDAVLGVIIYKYEDEFLEAYDSWPCYLFYFCAYGFLIVICRVMDATSLTWGKRDYFGRYKMGSGIGWGICSAILGYIADQPGWSIDIMFPTMTVVCLVIAAMFLLAAFKKGDAARKESAEERPFKESWAIFKQGLDWRACWIVLNFLVMGISFATISLYLFLWLEDLGGSQFLMGLTLVMTIFGEVPCFYLYDRALKYFGPKRIIGLGALGYMIRALWYACLGTEFLPSPWLVLIVEVLHGLTFAWVYASVSVYAILIAPIELKTFAVGLLGTIFLGCGGVIGGLVGGVIYNFFGARVLFLSLAASLVPFAIVGLCGKADELPKGFWDQPEVVDDGYMAIGDLEDNKQTDGGESAPLLRKRTHSALSPMCKDILSPMAMSQLQNSPIVTRTPG